MVGSGTTATVVDEVTLVAPAFVTVSVNVVVALSVPVEIAMPLVTAPTP